GQWVGCAVGWTKAVGRASGNGGTDLGRPATVGGMSEHTLTQAHRADRGPSTPPARPADEVKLVELRKLRLERVVLVGVAVDGSVEQAERAVEELHRLAETAGGGGPGTTRPRPPRADAGTFIGKGKAKELAAAVRSLGADTVI